MKHPARIVAAITLVTASIGIALWASGYPPPREGLEGWRMTAHTVLSWPLTFALLGLVLAVPCLYFKRNQPGIWETKQGRLALVAVLANPVIMLFMQIEFPLKRLDIISDYTGDLTFLIIQTFLLILFGNYMAVQQPGSPQGLRNRWTLASDAVWTKTHRFFGTALIVSLLVAAPLAGFLIREDAVYIVAATTVFVWLLSMLHSWRLSTQAGAGNLA